jgi:hypothetical protein
MVLFQSIRARIIESNPVRGVPLLIVLMPFAQFAKSDDIFIIVSLFSVGRIQYDGDLPLFSFATKFNFLKYCSAINCCWRSRMRKTRSLYQSAAER